MNEKGYSIEPLNMIMALVAMLGAVLILIGRGDYGLIALIIATLFEAMGRVIK
ncbi:hypothetical protein J4447_00280 [Candidatus Pacearchaeota archaeon]|nr:hypothetical protein [Candidatus Pacearchaeota archaeon]